jgi:hypothetical protein
MKSHGEARRELLSSARVAFRRSFVRGRVSPLVVLQALGGMVWVVVERNRDALRDEIRHACQALVLTRARVDGAPCRVGAGRLIRH